MTAPAQEYDTTIPYCQCMPDEERMLPPKSVYVFCGKPAVAMLVLSVIHRRHICAEHKAQLGDAFTYQPLQADQPTTSQT